VAPPVSFRPAVPTAAAPHEPGPLALAAPALQPLAVLRDVSAILKHSLCAGSLLEQSLQLLRELTGVNRAAIFLHQPSLDAARSPGHAGRLTCACALGLAPALQEHLQLSLDSGIGAHLRRYGRILQRHSPEAQADAEIAKEFELLGAQVAVPVAGREALLGVALFDERLTGGPLSNAELGLIFHLLEEIGLAVKNIWLHDQLAANHETLGNVLKQLQSACVVVGRDLAIRHANRAALRAFGRGGRDGLEFADLPPVLASRIHQVGQTGAGIDTFDFEPAGKPETVYRVTVVPLPHQGDPALDAVLLVAEDQSVPRQLQKLQLEGARLRLLKAAGDRLAHEIGNALVPLATHQQLLPHKFKDADFRASLENALSDGVTRINRLVSQMRFIARDAVVEPRAVKLSNLVNEAYEEARKHCAVKSANLKYDAEEQLTVPGDPTALRLALTETIINALQANPDDAKVSVRFSAESVGVGHRWARIEVEDNGPGFTVESARRAVEPFYTTRTVGLGLGLTVSQRIIDAHHGKLEINPSRDGGHGLIRISLPANPEVSAN
jgi:signal transduction histidine kinase